MGETRTDVTRYMPMTEEEAVRIPGGQAWVGIELKAE